MEKQINTQYSGVQVISSDEPRFQRVTSWLTSLGHPLPPVFIPYAMVSVERVDDEEEFNAMFLGAYDQGVNDTVIHVSFKPTMPGSLTIDGETWAV